MTQENRTIRLYDLYRRGRWLLLEWAFTKEGATLLQNVSTPPYIEKLLMDCTRNGIPTSGASVLRDVGRLASEAFGVNKPAVHVIRPDGVIGYRGLTNTKKLMEYLERVFLPESTS